MTEPPNRKPRTAAELLAELQSDAGYQAWQAQLEQERELAVAAYQEAAASLLADLREAGFEVHSVGELLQTGKPYPDAIPILLNWLPRLDDPRMREDVVRALSVPWAKPEAASALIAEFRSVPDDTGTGLRWAVANALEVVADDSVFDEIAGLVKDRRYGRAREMLALALGNMHDDRAVNTLIELLDDEEVAGHALIGLGRLGSREAIPHLAPFLDHPTSWIRNEARNALRRVERA